MIGIIGPEDSVIRASSVAAGLGLGDAVLTRSYETWQSVPALATELDAVCGVLLFTGRVPYTIARKSPGIQASLDFIPHDGTEDSVTVEWAAGEEKLVVRLPRRAE